MRYYRLLRETHLWFLIVRMPGKADEPVIVLDLDGV